MPDDRLVSFGARLLVSWLNERFGAAFTLTEAEDGVLVAVDGGHRAGVFVGPLWETSPAWEERLRAMERRLDAGTPDGAFLLWVPPRADVPSGEPAASEFVARVGAAAASLPAGGRTEVLFPVTVKLAKMREEGGYASVIGGFSRWWTRITEKVNGTFHVESSAVHRVTQDGEARERLWDDIGRLSHSIEVGQGVDFQVDEAWTLQRLAAMAGLPEPGERGFALVSAPPSADPTEGILVRRMARKRLLAANEALAAVDVELRAVGLAGCYEYAQVEGAGATVKALDPSLFSRLQVVCVLVDGEVRPTFLPRALPWAAT